MHIAAYSLLVQHTIPAVERLRDALRSKADAFMDIVKVFDAMVTCGVPYGRCSYITVYT